ncbi:STY1053 family phage-associated protein [Pantoea agglomerans]|uniref:STY1053 family phage-associated protein n=1 Tax=Enterobacter agglomerans TaxID=549 RepID=UPI0032088F71
MAKKTIRVHTPFKFNSEDGTAQEFSVGEHTVDDKVADHWFVAAHSEVTGKVKAPADTKEFQAQIDSLTTQLEDKDKSIGDLQLSVTEKDEIIADLTEQLAALQQPVTDPAPEGNNDGKKQKPADSK